jgi:C4-dicarboxylate-specific signal transduction histidine kinase
VPTFDWRALQRWDIPEEALPPGSQIRFRSPSVWREYGAYIAVALVIIVLQGATIVALVLERRQRRRLNAERERTELELRQKARELAHVGRVSVMGELAASLAHELSQPLTAIYANARAALRFQEQGESAESREAIEELLKDQTRAAEVVRHMRRFVRKETVTEFSEVDLGDVIREVVALIRIDAASNSVEVVCDVDGRLPAIRGDRVQLQQVLLNLLLNALDAMSDSSRRRVVTITARSGESVNVIEVADSGHGIPVDQVERVFEPFYTTKLQGLGVGLSICRAIIRAHGGALSAVNNDLGGATFAITLPVPQA